MGEPSATTLPPNAALSDALDGAPNTRDLRGFVLVDKPAGITSRSVDDTLKHKLGKLLGTTAKTTPKVGHAGTLDPFATGVLILGIGDDTKLLHRMEGATKEYLATIRLGWSTPTDDNTVPEYAALHRSEPFTLDEQTVRDELAKLTGKQLQNPCTYSAKRVGGKRAYEISRSGGAVRLEPKAVEVYALETLSFESDSDALYYDVQVRARVSAGTYIRAIARDLGAALGVGGHLMQLQRTQVGDFTLGQCSSLSELEAAESLEDLAKLVLRYPLGSALTLGNFDGVHLGHQRLLRATSEFAKARGGRSVALVIDDKKTHQLTPLEQRRNHILQYVDEVKVLDYTQVQDLEYTDFLQRLEQQYHFHTLCMTQDMRFGKNRAGTLEAVSAYFERITAPRESASREVMMPALECVDLVKSASGSKISSSRIRELLLEGGVEQANQLLGRAYKIAGEVVHGFKRGRQIGFPTANLDVPTATLNYLIPADGVYFGYATWQKQRFPAMVSVGTNPTFKNSQRSVEVHIPGRDDFDLYGKVITVSFNELMRTVKTFDGLDALKAQLTCDAARTLELFAKYESL